jgi:GntR family transcriptional regulator
LDHPSDRLDDPSDQLDQPPRRLEPGGLDGLVLDRDAEVPIGVQLAWALRARIRDGRFTPGQRLPALRDLAEALGVNANTVRAVYQRLEHEGIIDSRQGRGTFVADAPLGPSAVGAIVANASQEALDTGVDPRDVAAALYVVPKPSFANSAAGAQAARRRQLRTRITALELTLGELEARHLALAPRPPARPVRAGPRLLDVAELEEVQAQLVSRLAALHAAIDGLGDEPPGDPPSRPAATAPTHVARPHRKTRPAPAGA